MERVGERPGWRPIPGEVLETATAVFRGGVAALGGSGRVPAEPLRRLGASAARPGFWTKLAVAGIRTPAGVLFPFPIPAVELLQVAVDTAGDPEEMAALLGPLRVAAVAALGRAEAEAMS